MGSDHSQFDPIHKPYMDGKGGWVERQGRVTHETHTNETKDRVLAEIDPAAPKVRTATKHDRGAKHIAPHKGKGKAKNSGRTKKGRAQKDV